MINILISGDYNAFADGFNAAGIYMASGLAPSNTFERPIYVGSSIDLRRRIFYTHKSELVLNHHRNRPLQNYYNKHGKDSLIWFLLETCEKNSLLEREQYHLDDLRPFADERKGFNIAKCAEATRRGSKASAETRAKMAAAWKNRKCKVSPIKGKKHSLAARAKMSAAHTGKIISAETIAKKRAIAKGRPFALISPSGELVTGDNLTSFCRERGFNRANFAHVLNGSRNHHKGWRRAV